VILLDAGAFQYFLVPAPFKVFGTLIGFRPGHSHPIEEFQPMFDGSDWNLSERQVALHQRRSPYGAYL
jgi:hypothetical protein